MGGGNIGRAGLRGCFELRLRGKQISKWLILMISFLLWRLGPRPLLVLKSTFPLLGLGESNENSWNDFLVPERAGQNNPQIPQL